MLMLLTVITNYPQAMLKSECLNEDNMSVEIVDKIYKSKNNYLDINVIVPQIKGLSNDKKEAEINNTKRGAAELDLPSLENYFGESVISQ